MKNFDFDFKPKDYYEKNIKKEDLLTPKDIEEFVENAVVIAGIDFGDGKERHVMASLHPEYLLRSPAQKRLAWADLLALAGKLL